MTTIDDDPGRTLTEIAARVRQKLEHVRTSCMQSLQALRDIGSELNRAHEILGRGAFGHWAVQNGFKKSWSSRLKKLDLAWADVLAALQWTEETRGLESRDYSADGALRLLDEHRKKSKSDDAAGEQSAVRKPRRNRLRELEGVCQQLTAEADEKDQRTKELAGHLEWVQAEQQQEAQRHAAEAEQKDQRIQQLEEKVRSLETELDAWRSKAAPRRRKQASAELPNAA